MLTERQCGLSLALLTVLFFRSGAGGPVGVPSPAGVPRLDGIPLA